MREHRSDPGLVSMGGNMTRVLYFHGLGLRFLEKGQRNMMVEMCNFSAGYGETKGKHWLG